MSDDNIRESSRDHTVDKNSSQEERGSDRRRDLLWILLLLLLILIPAAVYFAPDLPGLFGFDSLFGGRSATTLDPTLVSTQPGVGAGQAASGRDAYDGSAVPMGENPAKDGDGSGYGSDGDPLPPKPPVDTTELAWTGAGHSPVCALECSNTNECPTSLAVGTWECVYNEFCWERILCEGVNPPLPLPPNLPAQALCGTTCTADSDCRSTFLLTPSRLTCGSDGLCWDEAVCNTSSGEDGAAASGGTCGSACASGADCAGMACWFGICWDTEVCLGLLPEFPGVSADVPVTGLCAEHGGEQWVGEVCTCEGLVDQITVCQDGTKIDTITSVPCTPDPGSCSNPPPAPPGGSSGAGSDPPPGGDPPPGDDPPPPPPDDPPPPPPDPVCGNGVVEAGEQCDGDSEPCPNLAICALDCTCVEIP